MVARRTPEAMIGATLGAATWVGGLVLLRAYGAAVLPEASRAPLAQAVPIALVATVAFLALCFELSRRLTLRPGGALLYGATFASVHLVLDAAFLFAAFCGSSWAPDLSTDQLHGIAAFLPLGYLAMLWVPLACQRVHGRRLPAGRPATGRA
jgi:hypothetical protein